MIKECLECNTEIIDIQKVYIKGIEVCPYCFTILDIPIIENNIFNTDLIDTIINEKILNELLSNFNSKNHISGLMIYLSVLLMIFAIIFPLILIPFV